MRTRLLDYLSRVEQFLEIDMNEATTKNALIEPFLRALGYDPSNPTQVVLEFTTDVGTKKGEKVDYALLLEGKPVIIIECKPKGTTLDAGKCSQLYRYYTSTEARIGILTDGIKFMAFADTEKANTMDEKPFLEVDFSGDFEKWMPDLEKLSVEKWDLGSVMSAAENLKYLKDLQKAISEEFSSPSDEFLRFFIAKAYDRPITAKVKEKLDPLVKRALQEFIRDLTRQRLRAAMESEESPAEQPEGQVGATNTEEDSGIFTTEEEFAAFIIVRTILRPMISPKRVVMRDAKTYCAVLCDDNNRKPICRFHFGNKKLSILLFDKDKEERVYMEDIDDIYELGERLKETVKKYL